MRMIIDTDGGVDDAQAIMLALGQPDVTVEAITTVTGNVHVHQANRNVFSTLEVMSSNIPVYQGADRPLVSAWQSIVEDIHGKDGLGDWQERPVSNRQTETEHAVQALIRLVDESPGELTLVTLGPLTNIALAAHLDPTFPSKIKQLVIMGGTIAARGNTSMTAEFNIHCDPEVAYMVFRDFPQSTLLSWETTLAYQMPWSQYNALIALSTKKASFFKGISAALVTFLTEVRGNEGYVMPDQLAMAVALRPDLIQESGHHYVTVELNGALTRGQTVIDYAHASGKPANTHIVTALNGDGVYHLYRQMLS